MIFSAIHLGHKYLLRNDQNRKRHIRTALLSSEEIQTRQRVLSTEEKTIHQGVTDEAPEIFNREPSKDLR